MLKTGSGISYGESRIDLLVDLNFEVETANTIKTGKITDSNFIKTIIMFMS